MIVASLQPAYLPWLGFFEQIHRADVFILYDDILYNHRTWRNKNHIKTPDGKFRLTVPIVHKHGQLIKDARIDNLNNKHWRKSHWGAISSAYGRAPYFREHAQFFQKVYAAQWDNLVELDTKTIKYISSQLGLTTPIYLSSELGIEKEFLKYHKGRDTKNARILFLMKFLNGRVFYEGWAGKDYIDTEYLLRNGVTVEYQNYQHKEYNQLFGSFIPYLSVIDLLFNCGNKSLEVLTANSPVTLKKNGLREKPQIDSLFPKPVPAQ